MNGNEIPDPATHNACRPGAATALPTPMGKHIEDVYPDEAVAADFDAWWSKDGQYLDPDTSDVPWFDKRRGLADYAFAAGAASRAWPDFMAPPQYVDPAPGWTDPALPDFRAIWSAARQVGYAVGLHGSMKRDCDLIAVPWIADPKSPEELIDAICDALKAREVGPREPKPDGRLAVNIQVDGWVKLIDLSIVLPASALSAARQQGVLEERERQGWNTDMPAMPWAVTLLFLDKMDSDGMETVRLGLRDEAGDAVAWAMLPAAIRGAS